MKLFHNKSAPLLHLNPFFSYVSPFKHVTCEKCSWQTVEIPDTDNACTLILTESFYNFETRPTLKSIWMLIIGIVDIEFSLVKSCPAVVHTVEKKQKRVINRTRSQHHLPLQHHFCQSAFPPLSPWRCIRGTNHEIYSSASNSNAPSMLPACESNQTQESEHADLWCC